MVRLADPATGAPGAGVTVDKTRQLTLNEVMGPAGPLAALVNNSKWAGTDRPDFTGIPNSDGSVTYYSELPKEGETELWEIVNITADAHPIHLHLVRFQVIERRLIDAGIPPAPPTPPEPYETGYKDTVIAYPGQVTRVRACFDISGLYVWHCHIVEHEDNEMMRPYFVDPGGM